jgi:hypothetical protein
MTATSPRARSVDWKRSQARTRLLVAVRRAERRTETPPPREAADKSLATGRATTWPDVR